MGRHLAYWLFLGALGVAVFLFLRPAVDFNAGSPIQQSRTTVENSTGELVRQMGFSLDSLHLLTTRSQHLGYFSSLKDSLGEEVPAPAELNRRGLFLNSWVVTIGTELNDQEMALTVSQSDLFNKAGRLQLRFDDKGRVRRVVTNPNTYNPTFVAGDSLLAVADKIVASIFAYDLENYGLNRVAIKDSLQSSAEPGFTGRSLDFAETSVGNKTVFHWEKIEGGSDGPEQLTLEIQPKIREQSTQYDTEIKYGAALISFSAKDSYEPDGLVKTVEINNISFIVFFISVGFLVGLVFFKGIKHINKGQVEWKRALIIFVTVTLAIFGWRVLFLINTYEPFITESSILMFNFNFLLFGVVTGMYAALAYIGWEAAARDEKQKQLHLLDAFWQYRFFFRETGSGLLRGYALGGTLLGLFALMLFLLNAVYYQFDSQFGFFEPSMTPKLLTINMSGWANAWLVALGHVAVTIGFLRSKISSPKVFYPVAALTVGFLLSGSGALFGTDGSIWVDLILFIALAPVLIYAFNRAGLFTVSVGWWFFILIILVLPYWGSDSLDVSYIAWAQAFILGLPLLYGIASYRYGTPVSEIGGYIPEYQERMSNQLRVEKEIEIARESQFKLMPLQPPSVPGIDIYGFFLPSFEVGGDYFDYVVSRNGTSDPEDLTLTIADVSGKAMKAAMHAVFTSGLLLSRLHKDHPASILREVAPTIFHRTDPQTFITCIIAQYNLPKRKLTIANAGHCLPILKRDGKAEFIATPNPRFPLGLRGEVPYESLEKNLQQRDFLLFYSDGLPEAVDPEGNRFGFENLLGLVEALDTDEKSSNEIAMEIKRKIQKFSDYQLADDTTIICLRV